MKIATLARNGVSTETVELISRLVDLIPYPARRYAMGDVTLSLLNGKCRTAENVFGWNRSAVEVGIKEFQTGISCMHDVSSRFKPKTEERDPYLLSDIQAIIKLDSECVSTLLHANMTAKAVYDALINKGWTAESLPTVRTISNILNRQDYHSHTVAKSTVQKIRKNRLHSEQALNPSDS
jgi:hypothetical protein